MVTLTGCANGATYQRELKNDFQKDDKFMFHGLKYGTPLDELLKKENVKKSDLKTCEVHKEFNFDYFYVDTKEKLYGINGKVRRVYYCDSDSKKYLGGEIHFYFDDEKEFLKGCKKIGRLLRNNFGDPYSVNNIVKYDKEQIWDNFMNPPKFSTWDEVAKYNNMSERNHAMPRFQWGNQSKEDILSVCHSECLNPEKYPHYHLEFFHRINYYFICLSIFPKINS